MTDLLPTMQDAAWTVARFHDSFLSLLSTEREAHELRLYFYAVTSQGWRLVRRRVRQWLGQAAGRRIVAYVGTDHGITDPDALDAMRADGVSVKLLLHYDGVYHPKVVWFVGDTGGGILLVGSNNLSLDGLLYNVEFATLTRLGAADGNLTAWHDAIDGCSVDLTADLLDSYRVEREGFGSRRAAAGVAATFTWSRRTGVRRRGPRRARPARGLGAARRGDLILEIMDRETGTGGSQIQIPMNAAQPSFGLPNRGGASIQVHLRNTATGEDRVLTMTRYANHTTRLVIHELDYRDRPCVIVFRRTAPSRFSFEIVRESLEPSRYRALIGQCNPPTRSGSRRWA